MPLIKSAKKQMKVSRKKQVRNYRMRDNLKDAIKAVELLVKDGKKDEALKALQKAYKVIDTASKKNILHGNTADRKKSKLAKMVKNTGKKVAAAPKKKKAAPKKAEAKVEEPKAEEKTEEAPAEESK